MNPTAPLLLTALALVPPAPPTRAGGDRVLRAHDLSGLVSAPAERPEDSLGEPPGERVSPRPEPRPAEKVDPAELERPGAVPPRLCTAETLAAVVREHVEPALSGADEVLTAGTTLIALAGEEQQAWIAAFLERQRSAQDELIDLEMRWITGPRDAFDVALGLEGERAAAVSPEAVEGLLERSGGPTGGGDEGLEVVTAPRVLVFNRAPADVAILNQLEYVRAWRRALVQPGGDELVYPVVDRAIEGQRLFVTPVSLGPEDYSLGIELERRRVVRPIPTERVPVEGAADEEREVARPEERLVRFELRARMADGAYLAVVAPEPEGAGDADRDLLVLLRLTIVRPESLDR